MLITALGIIKSRLLHPAINRRYYGHEQHYSPDLSKNFSKLFPYDFRIQTKLRLPQRSSSFPVSYFPFLLRQLHRGVPQLFADWNALRLHAQRRVGSVIMKTIMNAIPNTITNTITHLSRFFASRLRSRYSINPRSGWIYYSNFRVVTGCRTVCSVSHPRTFSAYSAKRGGLTSRYGDSYA